MATPVQSTPPTDFDFIIGDWDVRHLRLNSRLTGCTDWTEFSGLSSTRKILGGFGNLEDNILHFPEGNVHAAAFRSYNKEEGSWAIWWLDRRNPHHLDVPVIGGFSNHVGVFHSRDTLDGLPVQVRFTWNVNRNGNPSWEQAFSPNEGATWETNWKMEFTRRQA